MTGFSVVGNLLLRSPTAKQSAGGILAFLMQNRELK